MTTLNLKNNSFDTEDKLKPQSPRPNREYKNRYVESNYNKWSKINKKYNNNHFGHDPYIKPNQNQKTANSFNKREKKFQYDNRRPRYTYASNSATHYSNPSPRRERKCTIKAVHLEDVPEVYVGDILNGRYEVIKKLGEGGFSLVVECLDITNNIKVAVKLQRTKYKEDAEFEIETIQLVEKEKRKHSEVPCFSLELLDSFEFKDSLCMVFPECKCTLVDILKEKYRPSHQPLPAFPISQIRHYAKQLLETLAFLHDMDLTHADIKPENVLLTDTDDIRLTDFGLSVFSEDYHSPKVGTRQYSSPEVVLGAPWGAPLDIWSTGCLLAELYLGRPLFETHETMEHLALMEKVLGNIPKKCFNKATPEVKYKYFYENGTLYWPEGASSFNSKKYVNETPTLKEQIKDENLCSLISSMLHYDPKRRISARVALAHQFIQDDGGHNPSSPM